MLINIIKYTDIEQGLQERIYRVWIVNEIL